MGMDHVIDQVRAAEQQAQQLKEEARAQGVKLLAETEQQARREAEQLVHSAREEAAGILRQASDAAQEETLRIEAEGQRRAEHLAAVARENRQQAIATALSFLG